MAEVNDKGEVTVEGEFVGRLEGFRFRQDKDASGQEAKTCVRPACRHWRRIFHLRADRFYNAPDTEIDFTEQGGLMWGTEAVGKLVAGADPLKPVVTAFVDDEAGADVAQKVERRLQHFIDRKIAALFEPLLALGRDEELNGLARGFAFQMVENLGVIPRAQVADDVKALDQDARGALRKHGVRFGQFTIFMPLMLKPAPTRLRLVLWALAKGLDIFPEAPPPGLVTVPTDKGAAEGYDAMAGYRAAGERSIRIDMLERLADMLRVEDSRGGFEAKADMLSITGMTLEQFADLMQGLGYTAERGERVKVKAAPVAVAADAPADTAAEGEAPAAEAVEAPAEDVVAEAPAEEAPAEDACRRGCCAEEATSDEAAEPEMEVFFTFAWGGRRNQGGNRGRGRGDRNERGGDRGERKGGGKPRGKGGKPRGDGKTRGGPKGAKSYEARPPKKEKAIDPDNPFAAALMGLKKG